MPVQVLNELRREGLAAAREKMLSGWRRKTPGNRGQTPLPQPVQRQEAGKSVELRVLTESLEQLDSLARLSGISGYYLPITLFRPGQWREEFRKNGCEADLCREKSLPGSSLYSSEGWKKRIRGKIGRFGGGGHFRHSGEESGKFRNPAENESAEACHFGCRHVYF